MLFEQLDGALSLMDLTSKKIVASLTLQESRLSLSSAITVSSDFKWLAASTRTRGAIWDIATNAKTRSIRGFRSGWFADGHSFYADFPKLGDNERAIVKLDPSVAASQAFTAYPVGKLGAQQFERYLLVTTPDTKKTNDRNWTFELRDYTAKNTVWSRKFARGYPSGRWDVEAGRALFWWSAWEPSAKDEFKQYPEYRSTADDRDYFFEALDLKNDTIVDKMLLKTNKGSFAIKDCSFDGDWLAVTTKDDRVITYSLSSGKEVGHVFGYSPSLSAVADVLVVPLSETTLNVYDLSTTVFRKHLKFSATIIYHAFSPDGKRMFVMTSDQTVYVLDLAAGPAFANLAPDNHTH